MYHLNQFQPHLTACLPENPRNDQAPDLATRHQRCPRGTKLHQMTRIWCPWIKGQQISKHNLWETGEAMWN